MAKMEMREKESPLWARPRQIPTGEGQDRDQRGNSTPNLWLIF
jgi:hypothetical protein